MSTDGDLMQRIQVTSAHLNETEGGGRGRQVREQVGGEERKRRERGRSTQEVGRSMGRRVHP